MAEDFIDQRIDDRAHEAERRRAEETIRGQLLERGIHLMGDEHGLTLVRLLDAVQRFERARAELGGDSMTNALQSDQPDNPTFVLPQRQADESATHYIDRVEAAADALEQAE